jgi:hypothetical protein
MTCTYCTTLPYGCPDGKPVVTGFGPTGVCGTGNVAGNSPLSGVFALPGGILTCACNLVTGVLSSATNVVGCLFKTVCSVGNIAR